MESTLQPSGCIRALSDLCLKIDAEKAGFAACEDSPSSGLSSRHQPEPVEPLTPCQLLSARSSTSDALLELRFLPSRLSSLGEEGTSVGSPEEIPEIPELNVESIHKFIGSSRYLTAGGVPNAKVLAQISGTGLAPWEIHRPQRFVRDLVLRRCFFGRVLDAGCGIGDNALYIAKACPQAQVTAVDVVPRCLDFAAAKAGLRNMRGQVALEVGDLLEQEPQRLPPGLGRDQDGMFDVVLDSLTFHGFSDADREPYVSLLRRLLRPGGVIYMLCMSEEETQSGGPRRITVPDLLSVFNRPLGWEVETIEESVIELHPSFWGGKAKARLFTIRKL